jgi:CheY-like chemotaxis protein
VVDDEPEVAAALAEMLERDGYDVAVAGTVAEAEGLLRRGGLDLVFCDLRMPGGGGLAVHRAAAAAAPRLGRRFIFVTGDTVAGPQTLREHGLSGEVGVIEKPFMPEDVARAVAALPVV